MRKQIVVIIIVVVVAIVGVVAVAARSHKTKTSDGMTTAQMNSAGGSQSSSAASSTGTSVVISNFAFSPANLTVKKGATVTWTNKDSVAHTVTGDGGNGPASGTLNQGDTYSFTFNTAGTFSYVCKFHSNMTGKVVVTE